jgi:hypothetical protein
VSNLQPPAETGFSLADFYTLKMESIRSSETSVHTGSTLCHIPEDGIPHSSRRESLKSYKKLTLFQSLSLLLPIRENNVFLGLELHLQA